MQVGDRVTVDTLPGRIIRLLDKISAVIELDCGITIASKPDTRLSDFIMDNQDFKLYNRVEFSYMCSRCTRRRKKGLPCKIRCAVERAALFGIPVPMEIEMLPDMSLECSEFKMSNRRSQEEAIGAGFSKEQRKLGENGQLKLF